MSPETQTIISRDTDIEHDTDTMRRIAVNDIKIIQTLTVGDRNSILALIQRSPTKRRRESRPEKIKI